MWLLDWRTSDLKNWNLKRLRTRCQLCSPSKVARASTVDSKRLTRESSIITGAYLLSIACSRLVQCLRKSNSSHSILHTVFGRRQPTTNLLFTLPHPCGHYLFRRRVATHCFMIVGWGRCPGEFKSSDSISRVYCVQKPLRSLPRRLPVLVYHLTFSRYYESIIGSKCFGYQQKTLQRSVGG